MFFDLFNPNNQHRTDELRRLENTREEEAQGEPGRGPIDLSSGAVLIRVPNKGPASPQDAAPQDAVPGEDPQDAVPDEASRDARDAAGDESAPEDGGAAVPGEEDGGA